jgi:peptide/nickel transport system substrate-binding protein
MTITTRHHPTRSKRWRSSLAVLVLVALAGVACGSSDDRSEDGDDGGTPDIDDRPTNEVVDEGEPQDGGELVVGINAETDGWNPGIARWADAGSLVGSTVMETLMTFNDEGEVVPQVAESITPNDTYDEWTIKLKPGIKFHDGTEVNAEVVKDTINFLAHGPTLSKIANDKLIGTAEVVDDLTVKVPLTLSWAAYDAGLAGTWVMADSMLHEETGYSNEKPVGTGPFQFVSWQPDRSFKVERFEDYRIEGQPHLDGIEFQVVVDPESRSLGLSNSDFDMIFSSQASHVQEFANNDDYVIVGDFDSEQSFIQLNTSKPPFDNLAARSALAYGTDRDALIEVMGAGVLTRTDDPLDGPWKVEDPGYVDYDPEKAREAIQTYLDESGAETLAFRLSGLANTEELTLMNLLAEQWNELGMEVTVDQLEQTVFVTEAVSGQYQAQSFRGFSYKDPDSTWVFWHSSTATPPISINFTQFTDDDLDAALETGRSNPDPDVRKEAYAEAVNIINSNFTHIWLYNTPYALIARQEVKGLNGPRTNRFGNFQAKNWWGEVWLEQS